MFQQTYCPRPFKAGPHQVPTGPRFCEDCEAPTSGYYCDGCEEARLEGILDIPEPPPLCPSGRRYL